MTYTYSAITTADNPYDPFDDFDKWYRFDNDKGYDSCGYLARLANTSGSLSDAEYNKEVERAIDKIVLYDPLNIYRKVRRTVAVPD